jgi:hypothetical protein
VWWSQPFVNDGGPLIVLPLELLGAWGQSADDYAAACDAHHPVGYLPVGQGFGVVVSGLEGMVYSARWLRLARRPGVMLVGWGYGPEDGEERLLRRLRAAEPSWLRHRRRQSVPSGVLFLLHAAGYGPQVRLPAGEGRACIGQTVPVGVGSGRFAVEAAVVEEDGGPESYQCVLCRWVPV